MFPLGSLDDRWGQRQHSANPGPINSQGRHRALGGTRAGTGSGKGRLHSQETGESWVLPTELHPQPCLLLFSVVLGIKPRSVHILDKCSAFKLYPQAFYFPLQNRVYTSSGDWHRAHTAAQASLRFPIPRLSFLSNWDSRHTSPGLADIKRYRNG